jgi:HEAT repeat protein
MKNLILTLALVITLSLTSFTQNNHISLTSNDIHNLITGIKSDNTGLKKSAVYMAGKYNVEEAAGTLIEQLKSEKDASVKVLIALALYKIGSEEGMEAVKSLSMNDNNEEVKRMSIAILNQWEEDKTTFVIK